MQHALDQRLLVDGVVEGLADFLIVEGLSCWLPSSSEDRRHAHMQARILLQLGHLVEGNADDGIDLAGLQLQHAGIVVIDDLNIGLVDAGLYLFPIVRIAHEINVLALVPGLDH
jgi:hypothetical protein